MDTQQEPYAYAARSRIFLAALGVPLLWLGSCRTEQPGEITIDKAEVFTRERLVNRRLQEQQWLEKKLDFDRLETTFQGSSDLREFRGIVAALKAQFDPLGEDLQEAALENQIQERRHQVELAAIQHDTNLLRAEIDRLKAQQDLARLKENAGADVAGGSTNTSATGSGPNGGTPPEASAVAGSFDALQEATLPDPQDLRSGSVRLTSVEKLRDELAYRNAVEAALRETELDDAHDLNGYTLRTLKFDISVTPYNERAEHIGMIRLTANPCAVEPDRPFYRAWQQSVVRQVRLEALSLQRRYMQGFITDDDIVRSSATKARIEVDLLSVKKLQNDELRPMQMLMERLRLLSGLPGRSRAFLVKPKVQHWLEDPNVRAFLADKGGEEAPSDPNVQAWLADPDAKELLSDPNARALLGDPRAQPFLSNVPKWLSDPNVQAWLADPSARALLASPTVRDLVKGHSGQALLSEHNAASQPCGDSVSQQWLREWEAKTLELRKDPNDHGIPTLPRRINERQERIRYLEKTLVGLDALRFNEPSRAPLELSEEMAIALCKIVEWRYKTLHGRYLYFNDIPTAVWVDGRKLYLPDLWPYPERIDLAERDRPEQVREALKYRERLFAPLAEGETLSQREAELKSLRRAAKRHEERLRNCQDFEMAEQSYEINHETDRAMDFITAIRELDREFKPYVYTVEPKELAQNISDVASAEKLSRLVLAAGAALPPSGISAGGYLDQMDRSQLRLQAILRRPLVVGFVGREDGQENENVASFGWALGPRFEIGDKRGLLFETVDALVGPSRSDVRYRQAEAQHSVQATMAVPGWTNKITFTYKVGWRDPSADYRHRRETRWRSERRLVVELARDYDAITSALLGRRASYDQAPAVLPAKSSDPRVAPYLLTEGEERATILIRGANLWRNPQVFIGGQKAEQVVVLPDMRGLYATFDKVRLPTTIDRGSARADLTIVTSQGIARLPQAVQILPKADVKPSGTVELKTAYAVPNGKLRFIASEGLIPKTSHFSAHLRARDITRMTWFDVIVASVTRKTGDGGATEMEFALDPSQKLVAQPARMTFDLAIQDEYGTPYRSVPSFAGVKGELVYFPEPNQAKLKAPDKTLTVRRQTAQSAGKLPVITYRADSDLVFQTDPNVSLDLFKRAHPWIAQDETALRIEFIPVGDGTPINISLSPRELRSFGNKPGRISIGKNNFTGRSAGEDKSKEKELFDLYDGIGDTSEQPNRFRVKVKHPNEKESLEVDGMLAIAVEPATR